MRYRVLDSDTGDTLGIIEPDNDDDESLLEALLQADYLPPPVEYFTISDGDWLTEDGERCVRDEYGDPVLLLSPDEPEHVNGDDDDDDDEPDTEELEP